MYTTADPTNDADAPGTEVSRAPTPPPVRDSAHASVRPLDAQQPEHRLFERLVVGAEHDVAEPGAHLCDEGFRQRLGGRRADGPFAVSRTFTSPIDAR